MQNGCLCWCHCLAVKLCVVSLLHKGHSSWQHKARAISGWWMTRPTGQALTSLISLARLGNLLIFSALELKFGGAVSPQSVGLYCISFAQWQVLVTPHIHTFTYGQKYTHRTTHTGCFRSLSLLLLGQLLSARSWPLTSSTARLLPSHQYQYDQHGNPHPSINSFHFQLCSILLSVWCLSKWGFWNILTWLSVSKMLTYPGRHF